MTPTAPPDSVAALVAPFSAAGRRARNWTAGALGLSAASLCAAGLRLAGAPPLWLTPCALAAGALAVAAALWHLARRAPDAGRLAQAVDRALGTGDLLASALDQEIRDGPPNLFTRALRRQALALAPRLQAMGAVAPPGARRLRDRALTGAGLSAILALAVLVGPRPDAPPPQPRPADLQALAAILREEAAADPALQDIARDLEELAQRIAAGAPPATTTADLAAVSAALAEARGLPAGVDPGRAVSQARAEDRLAAWLGREMAFSGDAVPGPRVAPRVTADLVPRGGDPAGGDTPGPGRMDAAVSVDDLDIAAEAAADQQSRPAAAPGDSPFIPPQLIEGAPRAGLAIDLAGAGEAPRQESLSSSAGGPGAAPPAGDIPPPPAAGAGQELVIIYSGITPRDTPVHYLTEAERADAGHAGATAGDLPDYPPAPPTPARRPALSALEADALLRAQSRDRGQ